MRRSLFALMACGLLSGCAGNAADYWVPKPALIDPVLTRYGFDAAQTRDALGIYYGQCAGTMQAHIEASPQLAMQMGFAARSAVTARSGDG